MHLVGFMKVVGGSASVPLARGIAKEVRAGFVDVAFEKHPGGFPDGERYVRLLGPVAGEHVVLVQTTHPDPMIVEFLLLADAIRDAGARRITAVVPYFGYGRQD
ncbi:MAG: ribose-phosphate diphosphokinase, partial [Methanobacteriota archaeon]